MLQPKRVRYRKTHKNRPKMKGVATTGSTLAFGDFGLRSLETAWLTARQIEAVRRVLVRHLRRGGRLWIRVFPDKPMTKKPPETRMGGGKGNVEFWAAPVRRGRILFEIGGVEEGVARQAFQEAAHKLPVPTAVVAREQFLASAEG